VNVNVNVNEYVSTPLADRRPIYCGVNHSLRRTTVDVVRFMATPLPKGFEKKILPEERVYVITLHTMCSTSTPPAACIHRVCGLTKFAWPKARWRPHEDNIMAASPQLDP